MTEKTTPQGFFVQDPFTEEVEGPLSSTELKLWYAKGGVEEWGVSRSPKGPWTLSNKVKGLATANSTPSPTLIKTVSQRVPDGGGSQTPRASQGKTTAAKTTAVDNDADSFGKLMGEVFFAIATRLRGSGVRGSSTKFLLGGAAVALLGVAVIGFVAESVLGASVPAMLRQNSGESGGDYRNRIAKDVFAGTWESQTDNNDIVMPDGSRGGILQERIVLTFQPSQGQHGMLQTMSVNAKGDMAFNGLCYNWEVTTVKAGFFGSPVARFYYYPTECPNAPEYGSNAYKIMRIRIDSELAMERPVYEFVIKDKDTLVQKNASPFRGPHISTGDKVWRRVK